MGDDFQPVAFPDDLGIPGFTFPESQVTIDDWVESGDFDAIYRHGWGIWAGLTADSGEQFDGQELRVFETWYTPENILCITGLNTAKCPAGHRSPNPASSLNQNDRLEARGVPSIEGFVKYDPTAADHIVEQELFNALVLRDLLADGNDQIPVFPDTAISLKPVFATLSCVGGCSPPLVRMDRNNALLSVYPGSQESCEDAAAGKCFPTNPNPKGFPSQDWPDCVWIDVTNQSDPTRSAKVPCTSTGSTNAFNLSDFLAFEDGNGVPGVLVGMHVTTREIERWTWQSFFWTPDPDNPPLPSSSDIAAARPEQLGSPADHYAMAIGYSMVFPAQPVTGGQHEGESIYSFNPYLEAGFSEADIPFPVEGDYTYEGTGVRNMVGVQSNCMTCHATATLNNSTSLVYGGDQYISLDDPLLYQGDLKLDFLWSIQANAVTP